MKLFLFLLALLANLFITSGTSKELALEKLLQGNAAFTGKFFDVLVKDKTGSSVIASPFSVMFPLGELALYAEGKTYSQLLSVLNLMNKSQIRKGFRALLENFENLNDVTFELAQRVYGNKKFKFSKKFEHDTKYVFNAEAQNLDFSKPKNAAASINKWVREKTNNRITDLISPEALDQYSRLVLVNAIYFNGNWQRPFNPKKTSKKEFFVSNDVSTIVDMMSQENMFRHSEQRISAVKILELPYKNTNFTFLCLLPSESFSVTPLVKQLQDPNVLNKGINSLRRKKVKVFLPSITTSTTIDLKEVLKQINVTEIFNQESSDLKGILKKFQLLYVSTAVQKAFIIINEKGSEATAANGFVVSTRAAIDFPEQVVVFNANRPFIYYILYKRTVLFSGTFTGLK